MYRLRRFLLLIFFFLLQNISSQVIETTQPLVIDESKSTIKTRFSPPKGFSWVIEQPASFGEFLNNFPLHPPNLPVRDYTGVPIEQQQHHIAILKIDVGEKDLQQCADAWIRLYAEYLWLNKKFDDIGELFRSYFQICGHHFFK